MTTLTKRRFTSAEFQSMLDAGIFEGERLELLEGEVFEAAAAGLRHSASVNRLTRLLMRAVGDRAIVSVQNSMHLSDLSVPEPDLALLAPREDFYEYAYPGPSDVFLLVEISDTTYRFDRSVKLRLYAEAAIREYWIVHVRKRVVEVCRRPESGVYRSHATLADGEELTLEALPEASVPVSALFAPLG